MLSFHSSEGIQIFGARGRTCEKTKQQRVKPVLEKRAYLGAGYIHLVWAVHLDTMGAPHWHLFGSVSASERSKQGRLVHMLSPKNSIKRQMEQPLLLLFAVQD